MGNYLGWFFIFINTVTLGEDSVFKTIIILKGGKTKNHRIQKCEWVNKPKELNYFKISIHQLIPFEKIKQTHTHFENHTA